ncbi:hypothetical protein ACO0RG_002972 [Hanseniaspora osmophila]|uniref:Oxidoreductase n=1 Tax=Hanseniaspora osmophila TaxID=56408 RepID=A0A1E5RZ77_9ASCO|nr:Uncharacterized protein AWRI3579_g244 [Hanseniaspora osmophila]
MAVLNVGIIGTGIFARERHVPSYEALGDKFKVKACFNRHKEKALAFAEFAHIDPSKVYDNAEELIKDPEIDLIDVLVPNQFNLEFVQLAAKHNKPILLEKPVAATVAQTKEIVNIAKHCDQPIGISENWLYLEAGKVLKKHLKQIGPIVSFTYNSTGPFVSKNKYATAWRAKPEHIGGFLSDGGVHQLALLTDVLGPVASVSALTKQVRQESGTDDIVYSTVKMEDGDNVFGTFTYGSAFGATDKWTVFKIYGENGSVFLNLSNKGAPVLTLNVGPNAETFEIKNENITFTENESFGVTDEFSNMYEAIVAKDKTLVKGTPAVCGHHLLIVAAFLESSKQNGSNVAVEKL